MAISQLFKHEPFSRGLIGIRLGLLELELGYDGNETGKENEGMRDDATDDVASLGIVMAAHKMVSICFLSMRY